jgi:DNA-binding transcriptional LysR family regulator
MEMRKLEAFCNVVELKSFTLAAKEMLLSQPTISEHIRYLEEELDQKLLERQAREITVTPVGAVFYEYAQKILRTKDEAIQVVRQYSGRLVGNVILGCSTIPGTYIVPPLVGQFHKQYKAIKTTLRIGSSRIIAEEVLHGKVEFGVVGAKWNEAGLTWNRFFSDELTVIMHPEHKWTAKREVSLAELFEEPFVLRERESGTRKVIAQILTKNGYREQNLQSVAEIGSTAAVKEAVKAGVGVAILSKRAAVDEIQCGRLASVAIKGQPLKRPFYLIRRKNRELSPVASAFQDFLKEKENTAR